YGCDLAVVPVGESMARNAIVLALIGLTVWACVRHPRVGFLGVWYFLILAPTSSILPLSGQLGAERRAYLACAGIVAAVVMFVDRFERFLRPSSDQTSFRRAWLSTANIVAFWLVMGVNVHLTMQRNRLLADEVAMWRETARLNPRSSRAWSS